MRSIVAIVVLCGVCLRTGDAASVEPSPNAADYYQQASKAFDQLSATDKALIESTADLNPLHLYGTSSPWPAQPFLRFVEPFPTDQSAAETAAHLQPVLSLLRQGAETSHCDWRFNFGTGNLSSPIPHLPIVPDLVRSILFRARYRWSVGEKAPAIEDMQALKVFATHVGAEGDGGLISLVVQFNIERIAIHTLLTWLSDSESARFLRKSAEEPGRPPVNLAKKALLLETKTVLPLARRLIDTTQLTPEERTARYEMDLLTDVYTIGQLVRRYTEEGLLEQIDESDRHYHRVGRLLDLPVDRFERRFDRYMGELAKERNFFSDLGLVQCPGIERVYYDEKELHVRWAMLAAAIAVVQHGPEALSSHPDPFSDGPFVYQAVNTGFELRSRLVVNGAAVRMEVGVSPAGV